MLQQQTAAARLAAGTQGRAAAAGPSGGASGSGPAEVASGSGAGPMAGTAGGSSEEAVSQEEVDVMPSPSEPVNAESTEDLQPAGGVLQVGVGWEGWRGGGCFVLAACCSLLSARPCICKQETLSSYSQNNRLCKPINFPCLCLRCVCRWRAMRWLGWQRA